MFDLGQFFRKLQWAFERKRLDRELEEEMRLHADLKTEKNIAAGMDPEEARYAAQRQIGNATRIHEESRQNWGFAFLESALQDIRYGLRGLRNAPGFATVALVTLALGIGATTTIFSIAHTVLVRPLNYHESGRIVEISTVSSMFPEFQLGQAIPTLDEIRARAKSYDVISIFQLASLSLTGRGEPEQVGAAQISSNFLDVFSVHPLLGRAFLPDDEQRKNGDVALLGYELWRRRFGADPTIVGKPAILDGKSYTIVGVLPEELSFLPIAGPREKTEVFTPLMIKPEDRTNRTAWMYMTLARLRPGVSQRAAQSEMDGIAADLARQYPKEDGSIHFPVVTILEATVGSGRKELVILLTAVCFLLLIACANVSNLILSRGLQRQREIAVRAALGASRTRILRQLLIESLLLALVGGIAGVALAMDGVKVFRSFAPQDFPRLEEIAVEPRIAIVALLISFAAALLCGLAPALATCRSQLNITTQQKGSTTAQPHGRFSLRGFLVVTEVALALVLLTGSALMVQSMVRLLRVDPGLQTAQITMARVTLPETRYGSDDARALFDKQLWEALQAHREFSGVALSNNMLLAHNMALLTFDPAAIGINEKQTNLEARSVSPGYLAALGIPLLRGRDFTVRDMKGSPVVVMINQSMAQKFFPGQDPVGKMIKFSPESKEQYQIVGIVSDTRDIQLNAKPRPEVYFPVFQDAFNEVRVIVRSSLDTAAVKSALERTLWSLDKDLPLRDVRTMNQIVAGSVAEPRFRTWLITAFAAVGLALTLIGIYGVISYSFAQRTHEIGIRIAIGAQPQAVLRMVLAQGLRLAIMGALAGVAASLLLTRFIANQLYDTRPADPATLVGAALIMLVIALAASFVPGRRATRVDPMLALRQE